MNALYFRAACFGLFASLAGHAWAATADPVANASRLIEVPVLPEYQWNGIAVSSDGRMFASFPRFTDAETFSVGEILQDGSILPYPGGDWNSWSPGFSRPGSRFVSVNAVFADGANNLWVVDPANPKMGDTAPNAQKLVQIDLKTDQVVRVFRFDESVLPKGASLNDVRVDADYAYLTEAGLGAIIVVDRKSGKARRVLDNHPSTKDPQIVPIAEGRKLLDPEGRPPKLNANNLELSTDGSTLLYRPTAAPHWYKVPTAALRDADLSADQLAEKVEAGNPTMPLGGTTMDDEGNIYLMDVERKAIWQQHPDGSNRLLAEDPRLIWPDAGDIGPDGYLYVPVAQINRLPKMNHGKNDVQRPFRLFKVKVSE